MSKVPFDAGRDLRATSGASAAIGQLTKALAEVSRPGQGTGLLDLDRNVTD
jgi:hypothetical protein